MRRNKPRGKRIARKTINYTELPKGRQAVKGLFFQFHDPKVYPDIEPRYDIGEWRRIFIEVGDLTEYQAAEKLLGEDYADPWQEWLRFKRDWPTFARFVEEWKEELKVKLEAEAMKKAIELMNCDTKSVALAAAKFIKQQFEDPSRGRPKKAKEQEPSEIVRKRLETEEEWKRVNNVIKLVTNGD